MPKSHCKTVQEITSKRRENSTKAKHFFQWPIPPLQSTVANTTITEHSGVYCARGYELLFASQK